MTSFLFMKKINANALLLISLLATFLIYLPGLNGNFQFDDSINILGNSNLKMEKLNAVSLLEALTSGFAGPLGRPIAMVSFAFNYYFSQFNPFYFKLTNLIIHLINGLLVFAICRQLFSRIIWQKNLKFSQTTCSLIIATVWLIHPINVSNVLYVVQRMNSLATLFTLVGIANYLYIAQRQLKYEFGCQLLNLTIFTSLAALSKENGILLPLILLIFELSFNGEKVLGTIRSKNKFFLFLLFSNFLAFTIFVSSAWIKPETFFSSYQIRNFDMFERILTEARILWLYVKLILIPNPAQFAFYHDDIIISTNLISPFSTLLAVCGWLSLIIYSIYKTLHSPNLFSFGILFFLIGHSLESSIFPLELAFEHRNYLPSLGILIPLVFYTNFHLSKPQINDSIIYALSAVLILVNAGLTYVRSTEWADSVKLKQLEVIRHPNSVRANVEAGYLHAFFPANSEEEASINYKNSYHHFVTASELAKHDAIGLFGLIFLNLTYKLPVEPSWYQALNYRLEHKPFLPSNVVAIRNLSNCYYKNECEIEPDKLKQVLSSSIKNPSLKGVAKLQILILLANYVNSVDNDQKAADQILIKAFNEERSMELKLEVVKFLLHINSVETASQLVRSIDVKEISFTNKFTLDKINLSISSLKTIK